MSTSEATTLPLTDESSAMDSTTGFVTGASFTALTRTTTRKDSDRLPSRASTMKASVPVMSGLGA